jgi:small conductance mechanosensitive channel
MDEIKSINLSNYSDNLIDLLVEYTPKVIFAIVLLVAGLWLIKILVKNIRKRLVKSEIDSSLAPFLTNLIGAILKVMLIITTINMVGIEVTSFIALLGAAGLAIGLALQGTLQNFAGGVIILLLKPFKVGDVIDAKGYVGTVKEIKIFYTYINTFDKKQVLIPNGILANTDLTNISAEPQRRNEWVFGIAYGDDYDTAKKCIEELIKSDERILNDPAPFIALKELGSSSVDIVVRVWTNSSDLWPVYFEMNEKVYKEFPKRGLSIPFPQLDVHMSKN